jgi:uncharacterized membrane protein
MMCAGRSDAGIGVAVWALDFKTRQYLKGSLWFLPLLGGITGALLGLLEPVFARRVTMPGYLEYSASTASVLLASIVGATAALTGFVVTVSVLVVQMATSSFSARYMRLWYRDRVLHILLALLVGTFTFSFTLLAGVEENSVPHLGVSTTGALMAADIFLFLFFLGRFVHRLRPVAVAALTAAAGRNAFDSGVRAVSGPDAPVIVRGPLEIADEPTTVVRTRSAGSNQPHDAASGRVLIAARGWEQYLALGVTEIRAYGASSVQVARRLRAMLDELHGGVRDEHRPAVEDELARLEAEVARHLVSSADFDRALETDRQGLGGAPGLDSREALERSAAGR